MLETYLLIESIAKTYEEIVLETKILKLTSEEAPKLRIELVVVNKSGSILINYSIREVKSAPARHELTHTLPQAPLLP